MGRLSWRALRELAEVYSFLKVDESVVIALQLASLLLWQCYVRNDYYHDIANDLDP